MTNECAMRVTRPGHWALSFGHSLVIGKWDLDIHRHCTCVNLPARRTLCELQDDPASQPKARTSWVRTMALRTLCVLIVAGCIGWGLNHSAARLDRDLCPAGFTRGLVHGALMPLAMPNLLVGYDVAIYAPNNTGRTYK